MNELPGNVMECFTISVMTAAEAAARGNVRDGHDLLCKALREAEEAKADGVSWGKELAARYAHALTYYKERFGEPASGQR